MEKYESSFTVHFTARYVSLLEYRLLGVGDGGVKSRAK